MTFCDYWPSKDKISDIFESELLSRDRLMFILEC